ncbi:MAG: hypothetical protein LW875_07520 [Proteobacteria bacterium]|nr:hypothetical protein [Pseudomonadota bacterium]
MKCFFHFCTLVLVFASVQLGAAPQKISPGPKIAVIYDLPRADFDQKIKPLLISELGSCDACEVVNITPYNEAGQFFQEGIAGALDKVGAETQIVWLSWNRRESEVTWNVSQAIRNLLSRNIAVIGSAGRALAGAPAVPLSRTVLGQISDVVIIGELTEKERLLTDSYFGPEMLTAVKPPQEYIGGGIAPLFFVTRWAKVWAQRAERQDWLAHFKSTKTKSRKLWPDLNDFFRN